MRSARRDVMRISRTNRFAPSRLCVEAVARLRGAALSSCLDDEVLSVPNRSAERPRFGNAVPAAWHTTDRVDVGDAAEEADGVAHRFQ